tara:strand:- start:5096 stop:6037 length:942 start_codon:yes stop_codon:yes gene_type:complete
MKRKNTDILYNKNKKLCNQLSLLYKNEVPLWGNNNPELSNGVLSTIPQISDLNSGTSYLKKTHIIICIDSSGSMRKYEKDIYNSFINFISEFDSEKYIYSLYTFNDKCKSIIKYAKPNNVINDFPKSKYKCSGMTSLRDTLYNIITNINNYKYSNNYNKNIISNNNYIVLYTDGEDTSSRINKNLYNETLKNYQSNINNKLITLGVTGKHNLKNDLNITNKNCLDVDIDLLPVALSQMSSSISMTNENDDKNIELITTKMRYMCSESYNIEIENDSNMTIPPNTPNLTINNNMLLDYNDIDYFYDDEFYNDSL